MCKFTCISIADLKENAHDSSHETFLFFILRITILKYEEQNERANIDT
jgi:hypothetical protein